MPTLAVLSLLAWVKRRDRAVIAHYASPNFAALTQFLRELFDGHGVAPCVDEKVSGAACGTGLLTLQQSLVALRTKFVLTGQVAMHRTDRECRGDGQVRQTEAA